MVQMQRLTFLHLCAVIIINIIFAGSYLAGKAGVGHFPPLFFSALRFLFVFVALLPFFRLPKITPAQRMPFFGFCLAMGLGVYSTMYLALAIADGVGAIIIGTQFSVPIAALLGMWMLGDSIGKKMWCGIVLAFVGVMIVGFDPVLFGYWGAFLLILLSAFFYAYANVLSQQLSGVVGVFNLNAWMSLLAIFPMLAASVLFEEGQWQAVVSADTSDWAVLLYSSLAVSLLGHGGMFILLRYYPVAMIMPYYVLMPIFGVIGSAVLFAEQPTSQFYVGAIVALVGVWLVTVNNKRKAVGG